MQPPATRLRCPSRPLPADRLIGGGSVEQPLSDETVCSTLTKAFQSVPSNTRVLIIIPDGTRTAPLPLLYRVLYDVIGCRSQRLDYLIALGTHAPMSEAAIDRLVGMSSADRAHIHPNVAIFNHQWRNPGSLVTAAIIEPDEVARLSDGLLREAIPVAINKRLYEYDQVVICGPVFPHEVAGFSGGAKYLFPGISGEEIINASHWLGALATSMSTIGVKDTAVRRLLHYAAGLINVPIMNIAFVMKGKSLHGIFVGELVRAWDAAVDLSAALNIHWLDRPVQRVLAMPSARYPDMWTAAKAMYKTEPALADGGQITILAPHIREFSQVHGKMIERIGYHVRDYFLKQWDKYSDVPRGILAHSTHVKGAGSFTAGQERARVDVVLATGIDEFKTRHANLGYLNPSSIDVARLEEDPDVLVVRNAGEVLYRVRQPF